METKTRTKMLAAIMVFVFGYESALFGVPTLFPIETGLVMEYLAINEAGQEWTITHQYLEEVYLGGNNYFHMREHNYTPGETEDLYVRSDADGAYSWHGISESLDFQIAPVGTSWTTPGTSGTDMIEIIGIESVSVPYGGPYEAYVYRKHNIDENSPYWYQYWVPDLGQVRVIDYWEDYPQTMELISVTLDSTVIPAPGSLLLATVGASMVGCLRQKRERKTRRHQRNLI